jgi:hypothetical protein
MTSGPEQHVHPAARIVGACRRHPRLSLLVAGLAVAAATATGYLAATMSQPAPAPVVEGVAPVHKDKPRDRVVWRDATGTIYSAKVAVGRFDDFLRQQHDTIETARTESRQEATAEIAAALKPVFAEMTARVPAYADWYFGYTTKYELMANALLPAIDHLSRHLASFTGEAPPEEESLVQAIGAYMAEYLAEQYAERVVRPRETEIRLRAAFDKSYGELQARWAPIVTEQRAAIHAFIQQQAGSAERLSPGQLSPDQAAGLKLDWDASRAEGAAMHKEVLTEESFRRGLLSLTLMTPRGAKAPETPDIKPHTTEEADEISHVIVSLFDKVVGPIVSQMGDLAIGIFAGGAASGTTIGMGFMGIGPMGLATGLGPSAVTTSLATAVPIGGAIGLATTVVAEMLSNRLEKALGRGEFEENIRQTVDATENAVETKMIAVLHEHIAAWYADAVDPVAITSPIAIK